MFYLIKKKRSKNVDFDVVCIFDKILKWLYCFLLKAKKNKTILS